MLRSCSVVGLCCILFLFPVFGEGQQEVLTNESIIKMVKVGLTSDLIIQKIHSSQVRFDLTTDGLVALKEAKVPDVIIQAMLQKGGGAQVPVTDVETPAPVPTASNPGAPPPATAEQFPDAEFFIMTSGQEKPEKLEGVLVVDSSTRSIRFLREGTARVDIPFDSITGLLYERAAKPRYGWGLVVAWPLLFTKSKNHYLTIHYHAPAGSGDFSIFKLHKKNYQIALATIEARTGMKIERSEER